MSKCKCTRMYCISCEDKCFDDKFVTVVIIRRYKKWHRKIITMSELWTEKTV